MIKYEFSEYRLHDVLRVDILTTQERKSPFEYFVILSALTQIKSFMDRLDVDLRSFEQELGPDGSLPHLESKQDIYSFYVQEIDPFTEYNIFP